MHLTKNWNILPPIPPEVEKKLERFPTILRNILYNRGYTDYETAKSFLEAKLTEKANDPFQLFDMEKAVDRIKFSIEQRENIVVYGDYDADGVTATALLVEALSSLGADVSHYIPNRFDEGYGLNKEALKNLKEQSADVVITVDCGIRALGEAEFAQELDLDLIITDHHHPGKTIPEAFAVINPKRKGDPYPDKYLAGVGVAFKLATALSENFPDGRFSSEQVLDLVALGTVADLQPLVGENRALVKAGLKHLRHPFRQGIQSLMGVAELPPGRITSTDIGFILGPRLNAAGRLDSALLAYQLLMTSDVHEAGVLAQQLDSRNRERQSLTRKTTEKAETIALSGKPDPLLLFAADSQFNPGVVGLVASKLTDRYYRPAVVAHKGEEFTRGSCRSIPEFDITEALDQCAGILTRYGGHASAAGFTVANKNLHDFVEQLETIAEEKLSHLDLRPVINVDAEIPLQDLTMETLRNLTYLQPTGYGNPDPVLASYNMRVVRHRTVGHDRSHLKLTVADGQNYLDAIAFRQGHWHDDMPPYIDAVYFFEKNEYNGRVNLQLNIQDLRPSASKL